MTDTAPTPQPEGDGLYEKYMLHHPADVRGCLRQLIEKHATLLVHAVGTEQAVSVALGLADDAMWIDVPRDPALTDRLLRAERLRFESSLDRITVRFATGAARRGVWEDLPALEVPLPLKLMHLQRREYVRREPVGSLACALPVHTADGARKTTRASIADIGGGGLAVLTADESGLALSAGDLIPDVVLDIPDQGTLNVTLRVQHAARIEQRGRKVWRAGCSFVDLTVQDQAKLLRYVMHLDRVHAARVREFD
jgi:c-di-GMP-binding flagellar brake protein YcgR